MRRRGRGVRKAPVDWRPPSDVMRSRAGTAPIRGERSSGTTRLGLMLQPRVAMSDAMPTARLGLDPAGSRPNGACRLQQMADGLGITGWLTSIGNYFRLLKFPEVARRIWRRTLSRRRRDGDVTWTEFLRLEKRYSLPRARVVHGLRGSVARSRDEEPDAFNAHVWICGSPG